MAIYDPYSEGQLDAQVPLAFRMMENIPGITASMGFANARGAGTIMAGGGFMDFKGLNPRFNPAGKMGAPRRFLRANQSARRANKFRILDESGNLTAKRESQYLFGKRSIGSKRAARLAAMEEGGASFFKSARLNNFTARPRALTRYHSLSIFGPADTTYTPFKGSHVIGKNKRVIAGLEKQGITAGEGESLVGAGTLSFITAGVKSDRLERKLAKKVMGGSPITSGLEKKLGKVDRSIQALAKMNLDVTAKTSIMEAIEAGGKAGLRGDLLASSVGGRGSQFMSGYARGALGYGKNVVGESAEKGVALAREHMAKALEKRGLAALGAEGLEGSVIKKLGYKNAVKTFATKEGAKVLGIRAASLALPGINVIATASLLYDLGKMGGELIKGGINLARDAGRSLKGDIAKPLFGSTFKDNEAAATSRARGVMAIQNSQLNARSALGNEGALMAAHFG